MVCCGRSPVLPARHSGTRYWPTAMFTVATVLNEWPAVPHPSVPSTVVTPLKHGSEESQEQLVPGAPLGCNPLSQTSWPLRLLDSEVVSPPALIADERWVILSWENARVPRSWQSSVGWVQSVAFKFRVPYVCGLDANGKRREVDYSWT